MADALSKVYLKSLDSMALEKILKPLGLDASKLRSLKRLQKLVEATVPGKDIAGTMSPLYALYDLRVAYSHLGSHEWQEEKLRFVKERLGLSNDSDLFDIYDRLLPALRAAFKKLADLLE